jgi:RNA polymerase sigma-70 factor (ECF subfamily)
MPRPNESEVAQWLAAAQGGSREALGQVLEACRRYLFMVARQELDPGLRVKGSASDLVQETFLEAQRDFAQFQGQSEAELLAWLRRLLLNNVADFSRRYRAVGKRKVVLEVPLTTPVDGQPAADPVAATPAPDAVMIAAEESALLRQLLARLPEDYRHVLTLWYHDQLSFDEISRMTGRSVGAIRGLWWRGLQRLKKDLEDSA